MGWYFLSVTSMVLYVGQDVNFTEQSGLKLKLKLQIYQQQNHEKHWKNNRSAVNEWITKFPISAKGAEIKIRKLALSLLMTLTGLICKAN